MREGGMPWVANATLSAILLKVADVIFDESDSIRMFLTKATNDMCPYIRLRQIFERQVLDTKGLEAVIMPSANKLQLFCLEDIGSLLTFFHHTTYLLRVEVVWEAETYSHWI